MKRVICQQSLKCTLTDIFKIRSNTQNMLWFKHIGIVYIKKAKNFENRPNHQTK